MAVVGSDLTAVAWLLKTRYLDRVDFLFKRKYPWLSRVKRKQRKLSGNVFTHPVATAESWGVGAGAYTADLPTPGTMKGIVPSWSPRAHRGRVRVYARTMMATADDKGAFMRAWASETESMCRAFMVMINLESLGDGKRALAYLPAADDAGTTVNIAGWQGPTNSHMVQPGMKIDVIDADDDSTAIVSGDTVQSVTKNTMVLEAALVGSGTNDYVVLTGSLGYALDGLRCIVDTADPALANHGGLDRDLAANSLWKAQTLDFDETFTPDLMDELYDSVDEYSDGSVDTIVTRKKIRRLIARELWEQVRYTSLTLEGRWKGLTYDNKPILTDPCCWVDHIFCLDSTKFELMHVGPTSGAWMSFDGNVAHRVTDKEAYEATFTFHAALACHAPNSQARGYDVKDPGI